MKKLLVFLFLLVLNFTLKAQYPVTQYLGGDSTLIYIKGAARTVGGFINGIYTDTTAANLTRIRQYQAAQIFTTNDSAIWFRMPGATKWVRFMPATPPSPNVDTSYWSLSGNYVADRVATPRLGTTTGHELNIITNDSIRLTIPVYGIKRVTGNENRYLVIDTTIGSNMYVGYMDGGSGSSYTAGNGLTLSGSQFKLGGTLTEPTIITGDATNKLVLQGYNTSNDGYLNIGQDAGYLQFGSGVFSPLYESEIYSGSLELGLRTSGNIYLNAGDIYTIGIPTVSSTTGRKVLLHDTATGKVERIDPATLVTTPTLQQVLTAGSSLVGYNEITGDGSEFVISGVGNTHISSTEGVDIVGIAHGRFGSVTSDWSEISLKVSNIIQDTISLVNIYRDSITLNPSFGVLNIDSLRTWSGISDTTYKKPMTWDTRNGRWEYAANWYGGGGSQDLQTTTDNGNTTTNWAQFGDSLVVEGADPQFHLYGSGFGYKLKANSTDKSLQFINGSNSKVSFIIDENGSIGINTLVPSAQLDVQDANGSVATGIFNAHEDRSGEIVNIQQAGTKKFSFHSNGSLEMADVSAPSTPASGYGSVYVRTDSLRFKNDAGTEFTLGAGGGGTINSGTDKRVAYYSGTGTTLDDAAALEVGNSNINIRGLAQATTDTVLQLKILASHTGDPFNIVNQNNKRLFAINASGFPQIYDGAGNTVANFRVNSGVAMEIFNTGGLGMESWGVVRLKGSSLPMVGKMAITNSGAYPTANHTVDVQGSFGAAITTTSTNLTLDDTHHTVIVTSGTPTITLPAAASGNSRRIYVIVNQTGSGVTISSYLDFTGAGNTTVAANSAIQIQSNGTNWYRIL